YLLFSTSFPTRRSSDLSIDWLCLPRFDSPAVFSAILGDADDGRWLLAVVDGEVVERRYLPQSFVLETTWVSPAGRARVTEFLPRSEEHTSELQSRENLV